MTVSAATVPQQESQVAFSFPAAPKSIAEIRRLIRAEAHMLPFTVDELDDIGLAISEVFTNLVQYAPGHRIRGSCIITSGQLEVRFELEENVSSYLNQRQFPTGLTHRGRGMPLLNRLIPRIEIQQKPNGIWELRLIKPVPEEDSA